jgi:pimeloyl-ACP methyl ester carboxylesterase/quercetin dioxygenase-like cupin family protein
MSNVHGPGRGFARAGMRTLARACRALVVLALCTAARVAHAQPAPFPAGFRERVVRTPGGADIFVRYGGSGPAVILLHGFGDTGDMWSPLATELVKTHTVVVPDLRGMGRSSRPAGGYDKRTQAEDIRAVATALGVDRAAVVGHDIGNMVAYAYATRYPEKTTRLALMDAPIPGTWLWERLSHDPHAWHFSFHGPDEERLVQGRERIFLDRFYNELSGDPSRIQEGTRAHYAAIYAQPGAMHAAFEQFKAFDQDARDNRALGGVMLTIPVLAVGGEKSYGAIMDTIARTLAYDVKAVTVPGAGHWLMEENPAFTVAAILDFIGPARTANRMLRISPAEFRFAGAAQGGTGTSGVEGIETVTLVGNPDSVEMYTIMLRVPPHTRIQSHSHRDSRVATVVSGTWYFGYGDRLDEGALKPLPAGSYYTEPPGENHFAETHDQAAVVQITGFGPSSTVFVAAPRERVSSTP